MIIDSCTHQDHYPLQTSPNVVVVETATWLNLLPAAAPGRPGRWQQPAAACTAYRQVAISIMDNIIVALTQDHDHYPLQTSPNVVVEMATWLNLLPAAAPCRPAAGRRPLQPALPTSGWQYQSWTISLLHSPRIIIRVPFSQV
jgi:hypothetical protein